jgi:curved DNA-binding protein CbpA
LSEYTGESQIRALIEEKSLAAENKDYLGLLGIEADASKNEIQKAFFELAKVIHPDKLAKVGVDDLRDKASKTFKILSEAYSIFLDPKLREAYIATLGTPSSATAEAVQRTDADLLGASAKDLNVNNAEAAKIFSHKGALLLRKGAFSKAEEFFRKANESEPGNPRYLLYLGWCILHDLSEEEPERLNEAKEHLTVALESEPENADAHYYMARYYREAGCMPECREQLELAVEYRRSYIEAKRELRLMDMRARKKDGKHSSNGDGWFFGLFKRK